MNKQTTARGVAAAAAALSLALAGCGSDTKTESASSAEESTSATSSEAAETSTSAAESSAATAPAGENYTIAEYIQDNQITEAQVRRGDEGAPTVNLPAPPGWVDAGPATPEWAYSQIVFTDPSMPPPPPTITAIMSKLTGDVDSAKVLEFAAGELRNLPQFDGPAEGQPDKLGGFDAVQVGGTYVKDGKNLLVAQKTTVIPADDGVFVLQINAEGTEEQMGPLMDATSAIDEETTITP
ncbi:LpqN/LpqT family lipoprotein [Mycobacterium sp. ITM-2016-00316]|uniref:LpqN/LpqT family lipoprotein n=1 Tax=Mycobacterium sp. ITM-2016-00316 TaxID=2099695 RepID=UPI000CFA66FC|nr:LpqN/LpqT family lipoprotein [Mycobacterium sp. ITM-2016-00316]WNG80988.1 LpqN/LpqT family lipoprotein [Mycobacterium sp. ITM-2016-00316]